MVKFMLKLRRTISLIISLLVLYLIVRVKKYDYEASVFVPKVKPTVVWEFVADFNNMRYLNPTM